MCVKHLHRLMVFVVKVIFLGIPAQWSEVYAFLIDSKNIQAGILKKSKVLRLKCEKVCDKFK